MPPPTGVVMGPLIATEYSRTASSVSRGSHSSGPYTRVDFSPAYTSIQWIRREPSYDFSTAASTTSFITGVMSTPMPSPSMNGTIGLSGAGWPGATFAPPSGTWMRVVVLISNGKATVSRMEDAQRIAESLLEGFDRHYRLFRDTTAQAKRQFDAGDWAAVQRLVKERIRFYDERVTEYVERLRVGLEAHRVGDAVWQEAKLRYVGLLVDHKRPELAETFFNSVTT